MNRPVAPLLFFSKPKASAAGMESGDIRAALAVMEGIMGLTIMPAAYRASI